MSDVNMELPGLPALQSIDNTAIAEFGNPLLSALVQQVAFDDELSALAAKGEESRQFIGFELVKAMVKLHEADDSINLYAIWEGAKATEKLNLRVLAAMGVVKKEIKDDEIVITWTDPKVKDLYDYSSYDKEKDKENYEKRFNNRKRLNISLSNAYKAAITLIDNNNKADDLKFVEQEGGGIRPVIDNAPAEIRGEDKNGKSVDFGKRTVATGATHSPTLASLVKIATDKHKKAEGESTERSDKGNERSGEAKIGVSDEDFGGMVNNLKRTINAQEGTFSKEKIKQLKSLIPVLQAVIDADTKAAEAVKAAKAAGKAA